MKIIYKLEIEYHIFQKNKSSYIKVDNYYFKSNDSIENRNKALNKLENFEHIFNLANKITKHTKLSILEIFEQEKIDYFLIPNWNIYYSLNQPKNNKWDILYGSLLESFEERMEELINERKIYDKLDIKCEKEIIEDVYGNSYLVIKNSPISEKDSKKIL